MHLFSHRIYRYSKRHRAKILSFFGGVTAAYVFLDLIPSLEATRIHLQNVFGSIPPFIAYLAVPGLAFIGFMVFFILEHFAVYSRTKGTPKETGETKDESSSKLAFAIHLSTVVFLSLVIGYILRFEAEAGFIPLLLYTFALSLHFIILDNSMERHYKGLYVRFGRYVAGLMPLVGWSVSVLFPESESEGYLLLALVLGVILFNAIKDEIPKGGGRASGLFVAGALLYSVLILTVAWLTY